MNTQIVTALIGLFGIIIGICINEFFIQRNKKSLFSDVFFNRKLDIYIELFNLFQAACKKARYLVKNKKLGEFNKETVFRKEIINIIDYVEKNALFVNTDITLLILSALSNAELNQDKFSEYERVFIEGRIKVIEAMKSDIGIVRLSNFLDKLNNKNSINKYIELNSLSDMLMETVKE